MSEMEVRPPARIAHHHPAVKWGLMVAMLAVMGLSLPRSAAAAAPSVQSPSGSQNGGVFTGPFTFAYYINCTNGVSYNNSYTSNLDGTNNFAFYGAADGSLLLSINSGGMQLLSSCGDPYTGDSLAASYNVSKNTAPTPTPTPPPAPTPTPVPPGSGGSSGGTSSGSGSGSSSSSGGSSAGSHNQTTHPSATTGASTSTSPVTQSSQTASSPTASMSPAVSSGGGTPAVSHVGTPAASHRLAAKTSHHTRLIVLLILLLTLVAGGIFARDIIRRQIGQITLATSWRIEPYLFRLRRLRYRRVVPVRKGLSRHRYSGRLLAHHHTSYPALAFLLIVGALALGSTSLASHADSTLSLDVSGPAPAQGADITSPSDGAMVSDSILTVRGTCGEGLRVELTRNTDFAGSTLCDNSGLYNLEISLVDGTNLLAAKDYDGADQAGPTTPAITVTYTAPAAPVSPTGTTSATPTPTSSPAAASGVSGPTSSGATASSSTAALTISVDKHYYTGITAGSPFTWPFSVSGGTAPYQADVDWGDQATTTQSIPQPAQVSPSHTYASAGTFHIKASVTDHAGRQSVMSMVVVVLGASIAAVTSSPNRDGTLSIAWPLLIGATLVVVSFWLGERDRLHRLPPAAVPVPI